MPLTPSADTDALFTVDKSMLKPGFHTFYIRAKDQINSWTLHIAKPFLITAPVVKSQSKIYRIEYYFFKDGVASDTFSVTGFEPGSDLEITFQPDFTDLLQDSTYDFHVIVLDSAGRRSLDFVFGDQIINDIETEALTVLLPKTLELKANQRWPVRSAALLFCGFILLMADSHENNT